MIPLTRAMNLIIIIEPNTSGRYPLLKFWNGEGHTLLRST